MFYILAGIGGFLIVLGGLIFVVDAFKVHWGWGLANLFVPFAGLVCLCKYWGETKRGFLLSLIAIPFLVGASFTMPKPEVKGGVSTEVKDPFYQAMQKAREAVTKVQNSRKEETPPVLPGTPAAGEVGDSSPLPAPTPKLSYAQRLSANRTVFKTLETDFAALKLKRKSLPKNDLPAIAAFNLEAKAYADKLAEARSEQATLLELQRTAVKK